MILQHKKSDSGEGNGGIIVHSGCGRRMMCAGKTINENIFCFLLQHNCMENQNNCLEYSHLRIKILYILLKRCGDDVLTLLPPNESGCFSISSHQAVKRFFQLNEITLKSSKKIDIN